MIRAPGCLLVLLNSLSPDTDLLSGWLSKSLKHASALKAPLGRTLHGKAAWVAASAASRRGRNPRLPCTLVLPTGPLWSGPWKALPSTARRVQFFPQGLPRQWRCGSLPVCLPGD